MRRLMWHFFAVLLVPAGYSDGDYTYFAYCLSSFVSGVTDEPVSQASSNLMWYVADLADVASLSGVVKRSLPLAAE